LQPAELLHFIELDEFQQDWSALGLAVEDDLWDLQHEIMHNPERAPVVPGTGGLRKMRFAPRRWGIGKSGAIRVCYVYFKPHWTVLLVMAYGKNRKDTLSAEEKRAIARYIRVVEQWFETREG
jgi:hypothetical protein